MDTWNKMSHLERFGVEVAVAGMSFLGYEEWKKHHNKQHSHQTQMEYEQYTKQYHAQNQASWLSQQAQQSQASHQQYPQYSKQTAYGAQSPQQIYGSCPQQQMQPLNQNLYGQHPMKAGFKAGPPPGAGGYGRY
ncbi:hypothetical protein HDU84_008934 [Entophlyctis sp. JEL0112]|nr:hypothetical protein HDU84_008934 [Entophlyctis sp. JEL0112]